MGQILLAKGVQVLQKLPISEAIDAIDKIVQIVEFAVFNPAGPQQNHVQQHPTQAQSTQQMQQLQQLHMRQQQAGMKANDASAVHQQTLPPNRVVAKEDLSKHLLNSRQMQHALSSMQPAVRQVGPPEAHLVPPHMQEYWGVPPPAAVGYPGVASGHGYAAPGGSNHACSASGSPVPDPRMMGVSW